LPCWSEDNLKQICLGDLVVDKGPLIIIDHVIQAEGLVDGVASFKSAKEVAVGRLHECETMYLEFAIKAIISIGTARRLVRSFRCRADAKN